MIRLTVQEIAAACGGIWQGREELLSARAENIVTDSRKAVRGSLFIAIRGERTDGHRYIPDVLEK